MILNNKRIFSGLIGLAAIALVSSCNKDMEQITEQPPAVSSNRTLADTLNTPARANDSLFYRLIVRAGMLNTLRDRSKTFTLFVPDNNAMKTFINAASGGAVPLNAPDAVFSGFIQSSLPVASAAGIVNFNTVPGIIDYTTLPSTFPNFQAPTMINPAPTVSPFLRLTTFPSNRNGNWLNNIPVISANIRAGNGIFHEIAAVSLPPSQFIWDRVAADPELNYLEAAILRADSGTGTPGTLQAALLNIGANLTVYAPTDATFQATLTGAIYQALVAMGVDPATAIAQATALASSPTVFSNPALYSVLTAQTVKGIVVYHIMGTRAFNNNLPSTAANFPTLLNSAIPAHPGIGLQSTITGPMVSSATVKGLGNATAANVLINPTPAPNGTSDQHYLNGVLHKIDLVLLPQ